MNHEREFEQYLESKSELSGLYAGQPEVVLPKHLDAAILAEAHRAVGSRPGTKPKQRWAIPLGMVATVFVAVMIGLQLPYMLQDAGQSTQIKEEKLAALMDTNSAETASTAPVEQQRAREKFVDKSALSRGEEEPMAANLPAAAKPEMKSSIAAQESKPILEPSRISPAPAVKPSLDLFGTPKVGDTESRSVGAASVATSPSADAATQQPASPASRLQLRESASLLRGALSKEKKDTGQGGKMGLDAIEKSVTAPAKKSTLQPAEQDLVLQQSLKEEARNEVLEPEEWIKRLRKLKQDGRVEEFNRGLAELKKRYPNFPVPKDVDSK